MIQNYKITINIGNVTKSAKFINLLMQFFSLVRTFSATLARLFASS